MSDTQFISEMRDRLEAARQLVTLTDVQFPGSLHALQVQLRRDADRLKADVMAVATEIFPAIADGAYDPSTIPQSASVRELGVLLRDVTQTYLRLTELDDLVDDVIGNVSSTELDHGGPPRDTHYAVLVHAVRRMEDGTEVMYAADSEGNIYGAAVPIPPRAQEAEVEWLAVRVALGAQPQR